MLILPMKVDTSSGDEALLKWQAEVETRLKVTPKVNPVPAQAALERIENKAEETSKTLSEMLKLDKADFFIGKFGDIKDIVEATGETMLGLDESTVKATSGAADMSQKFASLGSIFGPVGTAVGAVTGAIWGWVSASEEAARAEEELTKTLEEEARKREAIAARALVLQGRAVDAEMDKYEDLGDKLDAIYARAKEADTKTAGAALRALTVDSFAIQEQRQKYIDASEDLQDFVKRKGQLTEEEFKKNQAKLEEEEKALKDAVDDQQYALSQLEKEARKGFEAASKILEGAEKSASELVKTTKKIPPQLREVSAEIETVAQGIQDVFVFFGKNGKGTSLEVPKEAIDSLKEYTKGIKEISNLEAFGTESNVSDFAGMDLPTLADTVGDPKAWEDARYQVALFREEVAGLKEDLLDAFLGAGVTAVNVFFDAIEEGKNKKLAGVGAAFFEELSEFAKSKGAELIVQGTVDVATGVSKALRGNPMGGALAVHGAKEIGMGAALGGAGIIAGRVGTGLGERFSEANPESSSPLGRGGSSGPSFNGSISDPGPTQLAPIVVYMGGGPGSTTVITGDGEEAQAQFGRIVESALQSARFAGPALDRRG